MPFNEFSFYIFKGNVLKDFKTLMKRLPLIDYTENLSWVANYNGSDFEEIICCSNNLCKVKRTIISLRNSSGWF